MEKWIRINAMINGIVWGKYMILFLLLTGLWLMLRLKFLPVTHCRLILRKTIGSLGKKQKGQGITSFQAVATALAGTLGVGSIVGVTTALSMGGPGALFWMCISAIFGMMVKYAEVVLAIHYRKKMEDGSYIGGPMTTLEYGCRMEFLGVLFAILCIFASFGIGNVTPANTITETVSMYLDLPTWLLGVLLALFVAWIMFDKNNRIMRFNEITIPVISFFYIGACCYLIFLHADKLSGVILWILKDAFQPFASIGGVSGFVVHRSIHYGISRGVFSNEAGMGSSPISHASVLHVDAIEQGFWGIFEVFFDTIVVCVITGLMILTSGLYGGELEGVSLTIACFTSGFGKVGGILFAVSIVAFAIPSILGWYYYARECIRYLWKGRIMIRIYQLLFLICLVAGAQMELQFVWDVADTLNGLMAIPNLFSLVILYRVVVKLTKEYMNKVGE